MGLRTGLELGEGAYLTLPAVEGGRRLHRVVERCRSEVWLEDCGRLYEPLRPGTVKRLAGAGMRVVRR